MSVSFHRRWALWSCCSGAAVVIVVCAGSLVLAGSPPLHQHVQHRARLVHSCAIMFRKADKGAKAIENRATPLLRRTSAAMMLAPRIALTPVCVPKLFLEACRYEHGPPIPILGAFA